MDFLTRYAFYPRLSLTCVPKGFIIPAQSFTYAAVDLVVSSRRTSFSEVALCTTHSSVYTSSLLAALNSRKIVSDIGSSSTVCAGPFGTVVVLTRPALSLVRNEPVIVRSEYWEV